MNLNQTARRGEAQEGVEAVLPAETVDDSHSNRPGSDGTNLNGNLQDERCGPVVGSAGAKGSLMSVLFGIPHVPQPEEGRRNVAPRAIRLHNALMELAMQELLEHERFQGSPGLTRQVEPGFDGNINDQDEEETELDGL